MTMLAVARRTVRTLAFAALLVAAAGCGKGAPPTPANALPEPVEAILRDADRIELLSVRTTSFLDTGGAASDAFHGTTVLGRVDVTNPADRARLIESLHDSIEGWNGAAARCIFNPRHALVATAGDRTAEILICFECGDVETHCGDERRFLHLVPDTGAPFDDVLRAAGVPLAPGPGHTGDQTGDQTRDETPAAPPTLSATTAAAVDARLRALMDARKIPGLSIAVGRTDGTTHGSAQGLRWSATYGVADLASGAAITPDSVFPLGSTSKPLTALLLGQLVDEGRIDLDAPIATYVPTFRPPNASADAPVTARLAAGHLSGIRDYDRAKGEYDNATHFDSVRAAVEIFAADPLVSVPGSRYLYSAYNFVLLSAAIESAAGAEFLAALDERLVRPLGLTRTGPNRAPVPDLVTSYVTGFRGRIVAARVGDPSNKWAAGGLVSTPREMVAIGNAVLEGRVVTPETFTMLTTPQRLSDGSDSGAGYGLGWRRGERTLSDGRVVPVVHHGGTGPGSMSFFVLYPSEGLVVSMQANLLFEPFTAFSSEAFAIAEMILADGR
jgi:serine beta-lactamase-like protein LACTB